MEGKWQTLLLVQLVWWLHLLKENVVEHLNLQKP
ncbi:hypothetical protein A2U01_0107981, partial [Trifolium medium]|nr:hypothetical protein [Trifolium medium]